MQELSTEERMLLPKFVCSFAWADLEVHDRERAFIARLMGRLELGEEERRQVEHWLVEPPSADSVDPALVPPEHRMRFVRAVESVIAVDGDVTEVEKQQLIDFAARLRRSSGP